MADEIITPIVKLSKEQVTQLESSKRDMPKIKKSIQLLKQIGMDTRMLEDRLSWAEEVNDLLLKEFK